MAANGSLRCAQGHSHDVARQGYVALFPPGRRTPPGDTPQMVAARVLAADAMPGRRSAQQAHLPGLAYGLRAVRGAELAVDVVDMRLDRAKGDEEVAGDLSVGSARGEQGKQIGRASCRERV